MQPRQHKRGRVASALIACLVVVVLLSGCSGSGFNLCLTQDLAQVRPQTVSVSLDDLTPAQKEVAEALIGIVRAHKLPERIEALVVATAKQESNLKNLPGGHGTSVGVFQQTDIYGSKSLRMDLVWATEAFLYGVDTPKGHIPGVVDIRGWDTIDLQVLAEKVQRPLHYGTARSVYNSAVNNFVSALGYAKQIIGTAATVAGLTQPASVQCFLTGMTSETLMMSLRSQIGVPYSWSSTSFDGAGLTQWAFQRIGVNLPASSEEQWKAGPEVTGSRMTGNESDAEFRKVLGQLQPGDLLFFTSSSNWGTVTHVAAYVGDGNMIDASQAGAEITTRRVVQTSGSSSFYGATRPITNAPQGTSNGAPGSWSWPLAQVQLGSKCGMRFHPIEKVWKLHKGQDFPVPTGTPVLAAQSGTVKAAGRAGDAGIRIIIEHPDSQGRKIETYYKHLSTTSVRVGQQVSARQEIAKSGNSGLSTGPHLHFEVFADDFVDSSAWIDSGGTTMRLCSSQRS